MVFLLLTRSHFEVEGGGKLKLYSITTTKDRPAMNTCTYSELDHLHEEIADLIRQIADAENQKSTPETQAKTVHFYERLVKRLKML